MATDPLLRLAVWSGPRNISTAMMRSWENRADTCVVDEPLYAHYLHSTGIDHPMAEAVIASQSTDWEAVTRDLASKPKPGKRIFYQKHISTHVLPNMHLDWCHHLCNCILIRNPAKMVASYAKKRARVDARDLGYSELLQVYRQVKQLGVEPVVVDTDRFLKNPRALLEKWCAQIGVPFDEAMLHWPAGRRDSDGVWGKHWYDAVEKSTGFTPYNPLMPELNAAQRAIAAQCEDTYQELFQSAL